MQPKIIEIDAFWLNEDSIEVSALKNGEDFDPVINRQEFETWIDAHGMREWGEFRWNYELEDIVEREGVMSWEEYWQQDSRIVESDLHEYLMCQERERIVNEVKAKYQNQEA